MESMVEFRMSVLEGLRTREEGVNASWERQRIPTPSSTRHGLVGIMKACMRVEGNLARDSGRKAVNTRICVFASMTSRMVELGTGGCSAYVYTVYEFSNDPSHPGWTSHTSCELNAGNL